VTKKDLLKEWDKLTDLYHERGLMEDKEERFLAGGIIEVENLLCEYFGIYKEFFS